MLEVPVLSALREIREETSLPAQALEVKAALPPYILDDGERKWQIWAMLWLRVAPDDDDGRHGNGGLKLSRVERLGAQVTLNHENVKCRWDSLVEFDKLEGKVPGLLDTFVKLVDVWIEREGTERRVLRKAKSNGQDSE